MTPTYIEILYTYTYILLSQIWYKFTAIDHIKLIDLYDELVNNYTLLK